jgi:hypothetical protein
LIGLESALRLHRDNIIREWVGRLRAEVSPRCPLPLEGLSLTVSQATDACFALLVDGDTAPVNSFIERITKLGSDSGFPLSDVQKAFEPYRSIALPLIVEHIGAADLVEALRFRQRRATDERAPCILTVTHKDGSGKIVNSQRRTCQRAGH